MDAKDVEDAKYMRDVVSRLRDGVVKQHVTAALDSLVTGGGQTNPLQAGASAPGAAAAVRPPAGVAAGAGSAGGILQRAAQSGLSPTSAFQRLVIAVHCLALSRGFVCTGTDDASASVAGFAAPIRDLPAGQLLPANWESGGVASLRYRHDGARGKVFLLKALEVDGMATLHMASGDGSDVLSVEVPLSEVPAAVDGWSAATEVAFQPIFARVDQELLSVYAPLPQPAASPTAAAAAPPAPVPQQPPRQPPPPPGADYDPLRVGPPRVPGMVGGGGRSGGDFAGDLMPGGGAFPDLYGGGSGGGGMFPGGGGLMGPGHPMFGGAPGMYPQPRFDPYGPPMPGQPRGPVPPNGGGGAGRNAPPFGEPNPDHLRPPTDDGPPGNMFF